MGALPKRKLARKNRRRSHLRDKLREFMNRFTKDPDTGKWILSHHVSPFTGKYRGKQVSVVKD